MGGGVGSGDEANVAGRPGGAGALVPAGGSSAGPDPAVGRGGAEGPRPEAVLLTRYLAALRPEDLAADPGLRAMVGGHVLDLAVAALSGPRSCADDARGPTSFEAVRRLIEAEIARPSLSPGEIADRLGIGLRDLQRMFEAAGTTCAAYIADRRLDLARARMADPDLGDRPLLEIARSVGFTSSRRFSAAFRRRFGDTPAAVRASAAALRPLALAARAGSAPAGPPETPR